MNRIACVVFLFLIASAVAAAERDTTTVEVVQVPVYVAARGDAVRGLTRDNFQLLVNGKPQPIDYFDVVDFAAPEAASPRRDPRQRRLYLFVFDLVFSAPHSILRAQKASAQFIDAAPASDLFAVASFTTNHGIDIAVPFTRDRVAVRRAISRLRDADGADPLRLAMSQPERAAITASPGIFDGGIEARAGSWLIQEMIEPMRRIVEDQTNQLAETATRLAPLEGQKHIVLLSDGFDSARALGGLFRAPAQRVSFSGPPARPTHFYGDPRVSGGLIDMHRAFNAAGVVLDAVDIAGLPGAFDRHDNQALYALTHDTGGSVADNTNDLRLAMERLTGRQRVVYLLGFHAPRTGRQENSIRVKLRNAPGSSQATYRQSYAATMPKPSATDGLRLADILQNDIPQTGVSVTATAAAAARGATVTVDIPTAELKALGGARGDALIYIYSGAAAVAFEQKAIDAGNARLTQTFALPPGRYAAKVLVRWDGALGFARTDFMVE
jgi:VWFA-related protein